MKWLRSCQRRWGNHLGNKKARTRAVWIVAAICLYATSASAEVTGHTLKKYCSVYPKQSDATMMCLGYISGTLDATRAIATLLKETWACETKDATGDRFILMTKKFLDEHPHELHNNAASIVLNMYTTNFPCKPRAQ